MKSDAMATNKTTESSPPQGEEGVAPSTPPPPHPSPPELSPEHLSARAGNPVFKSGPLFISSKGIGWTSWKKRWFILTRTSLVFFRSDPDAPPQKGTEVNLILGGIDLYNSGSVVIKADKKLLTVLFPDGRAFTLKAETLDYLNEWKDALEKALAQAPSAALAMWQNGVLKSRNGIDGADGSSEQLKDKQPAKSLVIGRPILLALEDVDGSPSFLEKALRFIEDHGVKVEGILRQAADVDEVEHRIREYEQGKSEFSQDEDGHVIGDCVKYFLRELPSSPVPASCCKALLEACRTDRSNRVNAMRTAICETFPEPNRRLLQRILIMMRTVASQQDVNRMSTSAVAACMAPLLLRPLLSGECEIAATGIDVGGDSSMQLLQAAAAANHAQAIVISLLEQYDTIFSEGTMSPGLYSDSEDGDSEDEEVTDDDDDDDDDEDDADDGESYEDDEHDDGSEVSESYTEDDLENASSGNCSESDGSYKDDQSDDKGSGSRSSSSKFLEERAPEVKPQLPSIPVNAILPSKDDPKTSTNIPDQSSDSSEPGTIEGNELEGDSYLDITKEGKMTDGKPSACIRQSTTRVNGSRTTVWGRTSAKKNLSMESIDFVVNDEELEVQMLEAVKFDLQNKISEEVKGNAVMLDNLEQRKKALHERRLALEKDVSRLKDQLQEERNKRAALEACLSTSRKRLPAPVVTNEKLKKDLEEITQAEVDVANLNNMVDELSDELNHQRQERKDLSMQGSCEQITRDRHKDNEERSMLQFQGSYTDKDSPGNRVGNTFIKNPEPESMKSKHGHRKHAHDASHSSNSKSTASSSTKSKAEGGNSALSKLSSTLNFLKERRSQQTNVLQNLDKSKSHGLSSPYPSPRPGRGSDTRHSHQITESCFATSLEKGIGIESPHSHEDAEKGQSLQNLEKNRQPDSRVLEDASDQKPDGHNPAVLDRGKSEGHVSFKPDKGKRSRSKIRSTPRTKSR